MSAYKDLDELILRTTNFPPLTNKGSKLTWSEMDENFTKIYAALQGIVNGANVPAYDAGVEYDFYSTEPAKKFASYNSRIWKAVYVGSPSGFTGQTPDEAGGYWEQVSLAEMLGNPVALTKMAEAFDNSLSPEPIYAGEWISSSNKDLFTNPLELLPASGDANIAYVPVGLGFQLDANVPFDFGAAGLHVQYSTASAAAKLFSITQSNINSATDLLREIIAGSTVLIFNDSIVLTAAADATVGTSVYYFRILYRKIQKQF